MLTFLWFEVVAGERRTLIVCYFMLSEKICFRLLALLDHTAYWAKKYAKRYPMSLTFISATGWGNTSTLAGFDPERVQLGYVPGQRTGRSGQPFMNLMLGEMHDENL